MTVPAMRSRCGALRFLTVALLVACWGGVTTAQGCDRFRMSSDALAAWHNPHPARRDFSLPLPMGLTLVFTPVPLRAATLYGDDATTTYTMGSSERRVFETNLRVRVGSSIRDARGEGLLLLGKYEITKGQYAAVMGSGDLRRGLSILRDRTIESRVEAVLDTYLDPNDDCHRRMTRDLHVLLSEPLTFLSYRDYVEFLDRLNLQCIRRLDCSTLLRSLGRSDDVLGFVRLPMEHEWEFVARGGGEYVAGRISEVEMQADLPPLPGSERITSYAHVGNDPERVVPIGSRKPLFGFYDLYGNAQELMGNAFTAENGFGAVGGHVARGGHYALDADELRASRRVELRMFRQDERDGRLQIQYFPNTGLRVAMGFPIEDAAESGFGDREDPDAIGDQAGDTLAEARDLGVVGGDGLETSEELTEDDLEDWYRFRIADHARVGAQLRSQRSLDIAVVGASGEVIARPNAGGTIRTAPLLPGEYWVRVSGSGRFPAEADYELRLTRTVEPDTGLARPSVQNLPKAVRITAGSPLDRTGFVGTGDAVDTYAVYNASFLDGIAVEVESDRSLTLRVLDHQLRTLGELPADGSTSGDALLAGIKSLDRGFVQVEAPRGTQAVYRLVVVPKLPFDPVFTTSERERAGRAVVDGRRYEATLSGRDRLHLPFDLRDHSRVRIEMTDLTNDVEMLILKSDRRAVPSDHSRKGTTAEFFSQSLAPGRYSAAFRLADQSGRATFSVALNREPLAANEFPSRNPFRLAAINNAVSLGILGSELKFTDFLMMEREKYFSFRLLSPQLVMITTTFFGLDADLDLYLEDDNGRQLAKAVGTSLMNESMTIAAEAGKFFIRVENAKPASSVLMVLSAGAVATPTRRTVSEMNLVSRHGPFTVYRDDAFDECQAVAQAVTVRPLTGWRYHWPRISVSASRNTEGAVINLDENDVAGTRLYESGTLRAFVPGQSGDLTVAFSGQFEGELRPVYTHTDGNTYLHGPSLKKLTKGRELRIVGMTPDGRSTEVVYSLLGWTQAMRSMVRTCGSNASFLYE